MGVGRLAPHRIRAKYARALAEIPLPVRTGPSLGARALTMLGDATVDGRHLHFGTLADMPKLWVAFAELDPPVLGYLSGLVSGSPELNITETSHLEWARSGGNTAAIKREAMVVWQAVQRECEG